MHITIASSSHAARAHLDALLETSERENVEWLDPETFISRLEAFTGAPTEDAQFIWLYAAPWSPALAVPEELTAWKARQQRVLRLRAKLSGGLRIVNVDRAAKGWLDGVSEGPALKTEGTENGDLAVLAMLFDAIAPEYWDTYETLESVSWLPSGTPELRHDVKVPQPAALMAFMDQVSKGARWSALQASLDEARRKLTEANAQAETAIAERDAKLNASAQVEVRLQADVERQKLLHDDAQQEVQSLAEQLDSLNQETSQRRMMHEQELEQLTGTVGALEKQCTDARDALEHARSEHTEALHKAEQQAAETESERKRLLEQLHALQEALEKAHAGNTAAEDQFGSKLERASQEAQAAIAERDQVQIALDEANKTIDEQAEEQRNALEALNAHQQSLQELQRELNSERALASEATAENTQLLDQLQLVQEALEKMHLASVAKEDRFSTELERASQELLAETARRDQVMIGLNAAKQTLEEQAEENRKLLDKLKAQQQTLQTVQTELQSNKTLAAEATTENTQLLDQLQLVQEELEKMFLAKREDATRVSDEVVRAQRERDEALREATTQRESMAHLTTARGEQDKALAELRDNLQREADKARSAEADSELLLDQLHQVQEELERYYLANREYQTVIERSTSIVRRAQLSVIASLKSQQTH